LHFFGGGDLVRSVPASAFWRGAAWWAFDQRPQWNGALINEQVEVPLPDCSDADSEKPAKPSRRKMRRTAYRLFFAGNFVIATDDRTPTRVFDWTNCVSSEKRNSAIQPHMIAVNLVVRSPIWSLRTCVGRVPSSVYCAAGVAADSGDFWGGRWL
jgi:hypothetical protein